MHYAKGPWGRDLDSSDLAMALRETQRPALLWGRSRPPWGWVAAKFLLSSGAFLALTVWLATR